MFFLVNKQPSYPNHILHPEVIPSLNDVPAELNKRRNIRFHDPLSLETYETEIPMVVATSLQDELQRAVQNRLENQVLFSLYLFLICLNRAAQDQNPNDTYEDIFRPVISPEQPNYPFGYNQQQSYLSSALSHDKTSLSEAFQRIKISGDVHDMSHIEDLEECVAPLLRALIIREK